MCVCNVFVYMNMYEGICSFFFLLLKYIYNWQLNFMYVFKI